MHDERLAWTAEELARLLGTTAKAIYAQAARGRLPRVRLGRRVVFPVAAVERWLSGAIDLPPGEEVAR